LHHLQQRQRTEGRRSTEISIWINDQWNAWLYVSMEYCGGQGTHAHTP
jgi:hypothetical protein